jgi:hypothetical protein
VFEKKDGGLCVRGSTIRAHLKDCAKQLSSLYVARIQKEKTFAVRVVNGLYVEGGFRDANGTELIHFMRNGQTVGEPDGYEEKMVHAWSPQGPINALKKFAYLVKPTLQCTVAVLGKAVSAADLKTILEYGAVHGYGGERSQGDGYVLV